MSKRYTTTYSSGHAVETSSPHEAANWQNYGEGQTFALAGKPVSAEAFYAVVIAAVEAAWDKKAATHKRVRVLHGSSVAGYVTKWARK